MQELVCRTDVAFVVPQKGQVLASQCTHTTCSRGRTYSLPGSIMIHLETCFELSTGSSR